VWTYFSNETGSKPLVDTESADNPTNDYWSEARTPLSSLLFLLPWIFIYELGVIAIGQDQPDAVRNGADFWMRSLLTRAGVGQVLLPLIVIGMLLGWHLARRNPWRIRLETQFGMLAESILLAIVLIAVGQFHDLLFRQINAAPHADALLSHAVGGSIGQAVSFIGAGVYEEVMFRLLLVPAAFLAFRMFEFPPKWAAVMSAVSTSLHWLTISALLPMHSISSRFRSERRRGSFSRRCFCCVASGSQLAATRLTIYSWESCWSFLQNDLQRLSSPDSAKSDTLQAAYPRIRRTSSCRLVTASEKIQVRRNEAGVMNFLSR